MSKLRAALVRSWALAVFICVFGVIITNCARFSLFVFLLSRAAFWRAELLDPKGSIIRNTHKKGTSLPNAVVS